MIVRSLPCACVHSLSFVDLLLAATGGITTTSLGSVGATGGIAAIRLDSLGATGGITTTSLVQPEVCLCMHNVVFGRLFRVIARYSGCDHSAPCFGNYISGIEVITREADV